MRRARVLVCTIALAACGDTVGREVPFELRVATIADARRFTTSTGWDVSLDEAKVVLGPIYLFENPPPLARRSPTLFDRLGSAFVANAWAHAGDAHFFGGLCLGEWLEQRTFDALAAETVSLGTLVGNAGRVRSFSLMLDAPRGALAEANAPARGHHAWVRGRATKDDVTIAFEGGLDVPDSGRLRFVDGIATEFELDAGGVFTARVDVRAWFDGVRFETARETEGSPARQLAPDTQAYGSWFLGARSARAYAGEWKGATK